MAQIDEVLEYMKEAGEITQRSAVYIGCYRLAAVIFKLKKRGYKIKTEMRTVEKRDGTTTRIAAYSLIEGGDDNDGQDYMPVYNPDCASDQEEQPENHL